MLEEYVMEKADYAKIQKLRKLKNINTYWDDVRRLTSSVRSDHSLSRWQILAEARYGELMNARVGFYND